MFGGGDGYGVYTPLRGDKDLCPYLAKAGSPTAAGRIQTGGPVAAIEPVGPFAQVAREVLGAAP